MLFVGLFVFTSCSFMGFLCLAKVRRDLTYEELELGKMKSFATILNIPYPMSILLFGPCLTYQYSAVIIAYSCGVPIKYIKPRSP